MSNIARTHCPHCRQSPLTPLFNLAETGVPHTDAAHRFTYDYQRVAVCAHCGCGLLETYSHDCYPHYEDEDWDMYWWLALNPADTIGLSAAIAPCPDRLNAACTCAVHQRLRAAAEKVWSGRQHAVSPHGPIEWGWLTLEVSADQFLFKVEPSPHDTF